MKLSKILIVTTLFIALFAGSAHAAFWLNPADLTLDRVQTTAGAIFLTVSWNAGANAKFYQVVPGLDTTSKSQILAALLTLKSLGSEPFRLHINNSGQVDGIEMLP